MRTPKPAQDAHQRLDTLPCTPISIAWQTQPPRQPRERQHPSHSGSPAKTREQAFCMVVLLRVEKSMMVPMRVNSSGIRMKRHRKRTACSACLMFSSGSSFCKAACKAPVCTRAWLCKGLPASTAARQLVSEVPARVMCSRGTAACSDQDCLPGCDQRKAAHLQREAAGPLAAPELLDHQAQHQRSQRAAALKVELVEEVLHCKCCSVNRHRSEPINHVLHMA